jgi:hypothetical protein
MRRSIQLLLWISCCCCILPTSAFLLPAASTSTRTRTSTSTSTTVKKNGHSFIVRVLPVLAGVQQLNGDGEKNDCDNDPREARRKVLLEARSRARKAITITPVIITTSNAVARTLAGGTRQIFALNTPPRWHPTIGISDVNPQFRNKSPDMNEAGFAGIIIRHVRKKKPSMWKYALRTYDNMDLKVAKSNIHHEGALVACAKLGLWERALEIFKTVQSSLRSDCFVTDSMVFSVVKASVRAARASRNCTPLDEVVQLITNDLKHNVDLPLVARHLNPVAAAYQALGRETLASNLIKTYLADRIRGPEVEDGVEPFNVHDVGAKDKASYSLLVRGAVSNGDWTGAVSALQGMYVWYMYM